MHPCVILYNKAMQDKKVLVFVGMAGAGKSVCVNYLKRKGLSSVYFGGITLDELNSRSFEVNEPNEKKVREEIRAKEGKGAYAVRIIKQIEELFEQDKNYVLVDGLYSWTEYKIFEENFGEQAVIIAVVAPRAIRHQRLALRPERPLNAEEATARDYAEIENLEKGGPIANADYFLANDNDGDSGIAQLEDSLAKLLKKIDIKIT
jgi:dephospho-CoA kinase